MAEAIAKIAPKKKGWFSKIPTKVLLSPAGFVLILYALVMELVDLLPLPFLDQIWELPLEIGFIVLLAVLAKVPVKASFIPLLVERIPGLSDISPTWIIRLFA